MEPAATEQFGDIYNIEALVHVNEQAYENACRFVDAAPSIAQRYALFAERLDETDNGAIADIIEEIATHLGYDEANGEFFKDGMACIYGLIAMNGQAKGITIPEPSPEHAVDGLNYNLLKFQEKDREESYFKIRMSNAEANNPFLPRYILKILMKQEYTIAGQAGVSDFMWGAFTMLDIIYHRQSLEGVYAYLSHAQQ